jgi:hypothetical protein
MLSGNAVIVAPWPAAWAEGSFSHGADQVKPGRFSPPDTSFSLSWANKSPYADAKNRSSHVIDRNIADIEPSEKFRQYFK